MTRLFISLWILIWISAPLAGEYPSTEIKVVKDRLHDQVVTDPYRWLEGSAAPEVDDTPELDAKVRRWTDAQNHYTRSVLDPLPGRNIFDQRLRTLLEVGYSSAPDVRQNRHFYLQRQGGQPQPILYVRDDGPDSAPRTLLDPSTLDTEKLTAISWTAPSADGEWIAVGLQRAGDENTTLNVIRVEDGQWLADEIPNKVEEIYWLPDSSGFFYRRLADIENPYSGEIRLHRIGTHPRHDHLVFEQYKEGPLATTWGPHATVDGDGRWLALMYYTGTDSNDLWVYDIAAWRQGGELQRTDLLIGERADSEPLIAGDTLFLKTNLDAPNGQVLAIDLRQPARENWRPVVPERSDAVIESLQLSKDFLIVQYLDKASNHIEKYSLDGKSLGTIELPGLGSTRLTTERGSNVAFLDYESLNSPESLYRVDLETGERSLWWRKDVDVETESIQVEQVFYPSRDGTEVSMFIARRKDLKLDGTNPTLLTGYGGFNVPRKPTFSNFAYSWIENGGVYAIANLRGGGEYGKAWHRAGMLDQKQNVFDDFIAAAEWLIAKRYTAASHLGIRGGSNGGLLTGAALVQRPELFSAVVSAVPLLDMLRYQHFLMARFWVPEYGTAENPQQFEYLARYSPYQNIEPGEAYPATLLTAGENDTRVHALHARKMAARLQAASASDPKREPILLWVERNVGHGSGKPLELRLRDSVDQLSFMAWQLGMKLPSASGP